MVVVQNIFSSLFNSHLFDFHEGWMYVLGVGVAGGMVLQARARGEAAEPAGTVRAMIAGMHAADELSAGAGRPANPRYCSQPASGMTPLSQLTLRNVLIATHDALATAFALFASFYLRFEEAMRSTIACRCCCASCPISSSSALSSATSSI